jgi:hypothetical protein
VSWAGLGSAHFDFELRYPRVWEVLFYVPLDGLCFRLSDFRQPERIPDNRSRIDDVMFNQPKFAREALRELDC